ncbi:uncharacterized protein J8A68_001306 [[Candida] subhashii]|uniref:Kinesin-like protein n=1 Tax=[Candida] subhashii TaxID=561895 RepID=A0A8J5QS60_9ASCO|nr:uncharacterized protein J8A68_001306 [[Candida] subhashii]KAG7665250.1 hypothetical protein J8A68_001306 [[Candida] subhashii]
MSSIFSKSIDWEISSLTNSIDFSDTESLSTSTTTTPNSNFNILSPTSATILETTHGNHSQQYEKNQHVKVLCRFRPPSPFENRKGKSIVDFPNTETVTFKSRDSINNFVFDRVFQPDSSQLDIYQFSISETVDDLLNGYNGTVLAYGQTGSGKSYTMLGDIDSPEERGIIPRIASELFKYIEQEGDEAVMEYTLAVSFMEIYMEKIKDLINVNNNNHNDSVESLQIHEDKRNGIYVKGLSQAFVSSEDELLDILANGLKYRSTSSTNMNLESSRSHTIFQIKLIQKHITTEVIRRSHLFLVDLAGSEKVDKTGAQGQTLEEAKKINSSLSALGNVINALTDEKSTHIPYRDSKLTRILQESLGGNSRTSLIINCSPSSLNDLETLSTLRFGMRAKKIKNEACVNTELGEKGLKERIAQLEKINVHNREYIQQLETEIAYLRSDNAIHSASNTNRQRIPRRVRSINSMASTASLGSTATFQYPGALTLSSTPSRLPVLSSSTLSTISIEPRQQHMVVANGSSPNLQTMNEELDRRDKKIEELENTILNLKMTNLKSSHQEESKLFSLENTLHTIGNKLAEVELININLRKHLLISEKIIESRDNKINKLKVALREQQGTIGRESKVFRDKLELIGRNLEELRKDRLEELKFRRESMLSMTSGSVNGNKINESSESVAKNDSNDTHSDNQTQQNSPIKNTKFNDKKKSIESKNYEGDAEHEDEDDASDISEIHPDPELLDDHPASPVKSIKSITSIQQQLSPESNYTPKAKSIQSFESEKWGFAMNQSRRLPPPPPRNAATNQASIDELEADIINFESEYVTIRDFLNESRQKGLAGDHPHHSLALDRIDTSSTAEMFGGNGEFEKGTAEQVVMKGKRKKTPSFGLNLKIVKPLRGGNSSH